MIKTNPVGTLLTLILVLAALGTAYLFISFLLSARKLESLQTEVMIIRRNQTMLQSLFTEALEYSKRDPTIEPLLQSFGVRARTNAPAAPHKTGSK
jgi:hypothetical protein